MIERIQNAFHAENLPGSYLTAPVKAYAKYFITRAQKSEECWEKAAWRIAHFVSGLVLYPVLGAVAALGVFVNCFLVPGGPNTYSVASLITPLPLQVEKLCKEISERINYHNYDTGLIEKGYLNCLSQTHIPVVPGVGYTQDVWLSFFMKGKVGKEAEEIILTQIRRFGVQHGVVLQYYTLKPEANSLFGDGMSMRFKIPDSVGVTLELLKPAIGLKMAQHNVQLL